MMSLELARRTFAAWMETNWDAELSLREWRTRLVDSGWGRPSWPKEWFGRGLPAAADAVLKADLRSFGAVGVAPGHGTELAGPTLLEHASDDLKSRLLRPMLIGDQIWCQLFSEPGAGSDLASLTTRAERDGGGWIVNGQKLWSSGAHHAARGLLLARTDSSVPARAGITCFALDMRMPGIEVRPIRQMNGFASFNEVFLTDVPVLDADRVGAVNQGWTVALTSLAHERRLSGGLSGSAPRGVGRVVDEAREEAREAMSPYRWYRERAGRPDLAQAAARTFGRASDPVVRQSLARLESIVRIAEWTAARARSAREIGRPPGPEGSLGKLHASSISRAAAALHSLAAGPNGLLTGSDAPLGGILAQVLLSVPSASIAGGTDEVQKNIIGERVLGLPREPSRVESAQFGVTR